MNPNTESAVRDRYAAGAIEQEAALCCPVDYDAQYLKVIPSEVIDKDYGCGDPSKYVKESETVLDLGSGTGKICFIASQVVGKTGKVIGIDMTDDMLEVANRNNPIVSEKIGYSNVEFRKGRIQDLALDLEILESELKKQPISNSSDWLQLQELEKKIKQESPLVEDDSIDVVVSNCVLNLVDKPSRKQLFEEIFRVLKNGGRAVISDIVCDEPVPQDLQDDDYLWSGCISGAFLEDEFLQVFEDAGFQGIKILKLDKKPWQTVKGIEFRSMTIEAYKPTSDVCLEKNQAVIYKGPWKSVTDDDGHTMERGKRYAVCSKTFDLLQKDSYNSSLEYLSPKVPISDQEAQEFDCSTRLYRDPKITKGLDFMEAINDEDCCAPSSNCC